MNENILQLGAVAVIFLFAIKEFFAWMKGRKESNGNGSNKIGETMLLELQAIKNNHLHELTDAINAGNDRLVDAINAGNLKTIELLGEIKGKLSK